MRQQGCRVHEVDQYLNVKFSHVAPGSCSFNIKCSLDHKPVAGGYSAGTETTRNIRRNSQM